MPADGGGRGDVVRRHALGARSPLLQARPATCRRPSPTTGGDLIAQGRDIPIHLGVMSFTVKKFLERVPAERLQPGDVLVPQHLPEVGGNHLPRREGDPADLPRRTPLRLCRQPRPLGRHRRRLGGQLLAAATETWQEGVRIPPLAPVSPPTASTRRSSTSCSPTCAARPSARAIFWPRWLATRAAEARLVRSLRGAWRGTRSAPRSTGWTIFPRRRCARRSPGPPDGVHEGEDFLDDDGPDGQPAGVRVRIEIKGDHARFDFSASDDAVAGPLNTTPFVAMAAVYYAIKAVPPARRSSPTAAATARSRW